MKKLLFVVLTLLVLASCKKYEEGPSLSLRSAKARVSNEWKLVKVMSGENDITSSYLSNPTKVEMLLEKDGSYKQTNTVGATDYTTEGSWDLSGDKKTLVLNANGYTELMKIIRLKSKELWLIDEAYSEKMEFHYEPK